MAILPAPRGDVNAALRWILCGFKPGAQGLIEGVHAQERRSGRHGSDWLYGEFGSEIFASRGRRRHGHAGVAGMGGHRDHCGGTRCRASSAGIEKLASDFNASQPIPDRAEYKGNYTETITAAIFAFRARTQPAIVQVNEIATATMMAAKGATYPVYD